jgi:hypothetical protein
VLLPRTVDGELGASREDLLTRRYVALHPSLWVERRVVFEGKVGPT